MKRKYSKSYENYRNKFYAEKKIGNIRTGMRVLSQKEFNAQRNPVIMGKKGNKSLADYIVSKQVMFTKQQQRSLYSEYKKIRKTFNRGEKIEFETYNVGADEYQEEKLSYHYKLSGLLKNRKAVHLIMASRISGGEDRREVLAEYGY